MKTYNEILKDLLTEVEQLTRPDRSSISGTPQDYCPKCLIPITLCNCCFGNIRNLLSQLQAAQPPAPQGNPLNDVCDVPACDWKVHKPKLPLIPNRKPQKIGRDQPQGNPPYACTYEPDKP